MVAASRKMLAFAQLLSMSYQASGHGWLTQPPARNAASGPKNGYCPHCGNGQGICGDGNQWPAGSDYLNFYNGPVSTWTAGSVVAVEIRVTAHHKGHYEFSICDQVIDGTLTTSQAQACLDKWILKRASANDANMTDCEDNDKRSECQPVDPRHPERFYLPPPGFTPDGENVHRLSLKIPDGLSCEACTLQWRWWSANSCIPAADYACFKSELTEHGYDAAAWGLGNSCPGGGCDRCGCGEEFRNCADITVLAGGVSPGTTVTSSTTTASATSMTTTTAPEVSTSTSSTVAPPTSTAGPGGCVAQSGFDTGAMDAACSHVCSLLAPGEWPCGSRYPCVCPSATTTTTTMSTTSTSLQSGGGMTCLPTPGLPPNGATPKYCAQCAEGYEWWPCNTDPAICTCQTGLTQIGEKRRASASKISTHRRDQRSLLALMQIVKSLSVDEVNTTVSFQEEL